MAFGVVVAGTGALSGTGGQKRYRVNRFRREIYRFGWALGGTRDRNHRDIDYSIRLFFPSMYAPHISHSIAYACVHRCSFMASIRIASLFLSGSPVTDRRFLPSR